MCLQFSSKPPADRRRRVCTSNSRLRRRHWGATLDTVWLVYITNTFSPTPPPLAHCFSFFFGPSSKNILEYRGGGRSYVCIAGETPHGQLEGGRGAKNVHYARQSPSILRETQTDCGSLRRCRIIMHFPLTTTTTTIKGWNNFNYPSSS